MPRRNRDPWKTGSYNAIDLGRIGLPEVPLVGIYDHLRTKPALSAHMHPGLLEISFIARGGLNLSVRDVNYRVRSGEAFVTAPDEYHSTGRQPYGRCLNYWLQLRLPRQNNQTFLGLARAESQALASALGRLPNRHFRADPSFPEALESLYRIFYGSDCPLRRLQAAQILVGLLLRCIEWSQRQPVPAEPEGSPYSSDIAGCLEYIRQHPQEEISVPELAARALLSPSRFKAKFKEQTGIPPGEFLLQNKVAAAKTLLQSGRASITDIAFRLGFSSSQYFATVFRRFTNQSPSAFMQRKKPQNHTT